MPEYRYFTKFAVVYDLNLIRNSGERILYDSISDLRFERCLIQHDRKTFHFLREATFFDSDSYAGFLRANGAFDIRGVQFERLPQLIDAFSYESGANFRFGYDFLIYQKNGIPQSWDIIDAWGVQRKAAIIWSSDLIVAMKEGYRSLFDAFSIAPKTRFSFGYDFLILIRERLGARWDAIPCDFLARLPIRWDANRGVIVSFATHFQSLVRPGWKILARNLLTEELTELGFINADRENRILSDVFLPDGEYEISVLTSSLFWKDAASQDTRTITVGADSEISPLPTIYNLRSAVQNGATIIQWSATKSEVEDCLFGVWFSSESPVNTDRAPDATVWYSSFMNEYQTSFEQNAPAYVAVAALRPGNESEKGKVHELFLDWSSVSPRAPDDVMVLAEPLPAIDSEILERPIAEEDLTLVF